MTRRNIFLRWLCLVVLVLLFGLPSTGSATPGTSGAGLPGMWQVWDDNSPDPAHNDLRAVHMLAADDAWAVGANTILHWNGATWSKWPNPSDAYLTDLDFLSSTDGWAVGSQCTILHWDGSAWHPSTVPECRSYTYLTAIEMVSPSDGWAASNNGTLLHWNGTQWSLHSGGGQIWDIAALAPDDVWAVGFNGLIQHWNGVQWQAVASPTTEWLNAVEMLSPTDGWAVGYGGTILHWNGATWTQVPSPTSAWLWAVHMLTPDRWLGGGQLGSGAALGWHRVDACYHR